MYDAAELARSGRLASLPPGIEAVSVSATLGGEFWLLRCPQCRKRFWALYEKDQRIACRRCQQLDYASRHVLLDPFRKAARQCVCYQQA